MLTPMKGNRVPSDRLWAADTGCFTQPHRHEDEKYLRWLRDRSDAADRCVFATAPDVVADPVATLRKSLPMLGRIRDVGYRAALVAQDGMKPGELPWAEFDALFLGGTTAWKLGPDAAALVREAVRRGVPAHMGRVNSLRRMRIAQLMGCASVDGTCVAFHPESQIRNLAGWLESVKRQQLLPFAEWE